LQRARPPQNSRCEAIADRAAEERRGPIAVKSVEAPSGDDDGKDDGAAT